jgi:hypothetical protein
MQKLKFLFQNISALNIILIAIVLLLTQYTILPLLKLDFRYKLPAGKKTTSDMGKILSEIPVPSPSDYMVIAEQNLFHWERKIPAEKKAEAPPPPKPELLLYGTLLTDTLSLAYVEDVKTPRNTPGRGKRQTVLRKGDSISGFILKEIDTDKIIMERGEEKMTVYVLDPEKSKSREASAPVVTQPPLPKQGTRPAAPPRPQRASDDARFPKTPAATKSLKTPGR